jgi:hypothetical protein
MMPVSLTLSPDISALSSAPAHRLTTRDAAGWANAGVAVSVRHDATATQIREAAAWLATMAEGRA